MCLAQRRDVYPSLGQSPQELVKCQNDSAEGAIHFGALSRAFSACLGSNHSPGAMPQAVFDTVALALNTYSARGGRQSNKRAVSPRPLILRPQISPGIEALPIWSRIRVNI